jgi:hypothetical protein
MGKSRQPEFSVSFGIQRFLCLQLGAIGNIDEIPV